MRSLAHRRQIFISLLSLLFAFLFPALQAQTVKLPETPQGATVKEYLEVFNSGDEILMRNFFLRHVSEAGLADRSADARVERMKMLHADAKSFTLSRLLDAREDVVSVVVTNGPGDLLTLTFQFEQNPQHSLAGIRIEMGDQQPVGGPPLTRDEFLSQVGQYLNERVRLEAFSGAVLIQRKNDVLFKKAFGDADKISKTPNRTDTKFNLGSINKYFTRVAIAQLLEQGKLSLSDRVGKILPEYPNHAVAGKVTVEQLLSMRSGMGDFFGEQFDAAPKDEIRTLQDYLPFFINDSLLFEPGTDRRYSNAGYIVLGLIIERLSGEDYYSFVRKHIFGPAAMTSSDWYFLSAATPNRATGYLHTDGNSRTWISNVKILPERGSSAGGGYSTLDDLKNFCDALLNARILSPRYSQWILTNSLPTTDPPLPLRDGAVAIAGGTAGVNAVVELNASTGDILVVLANYDPPSAQETAKTLSSFLDRLKGM